MIIMKKESQIDILKISEIQITPPEAVGQIKYHPEKKRKCLGFSWIEPEHWSFSLSRFYSFERLKQYLLAEAGLNVILMANKKVALPTKFKVLIGERVIYERAFDRYKDAVDARGILIYKIRHYGGFCAQFCNLDDIFNDDTNK